MLSKSCLPYILVLAAAYYLLPLLMVDTGSAMFILLLCLPAIVFINSFLFGRRHCFKWQMIVFAIILFIPTVFIYFNSAAAFYGVYYGAVSAAGCFAGEFLN